MFFNINKKILTTKLSSKAKLLYIDMIDRLKLSYTNNWVDGNNIFIYYSITSIEKSINISRPTAIKILKELEKFGYIVKKTISGKATKIFLKMNEFTETALKGLKKKNENEKVKPKQKDVSHETSAKKAKRVFKIKKLNAINKLKNYNEKKEGTKEKEKERVINSFKEVFGKLPDKSFVRTIVKKLKENEINFENYKNYLNLATNAVKPEAYIIKIIKNNDFGNKTFEENNKQNELTDWEKAWEERMLKRLEKEVKND